MGERVGTVLLSELLPRIRRFGVLSHRLEGVAQQCASEGMFWIQADCLAQRLDCLGKISQPRIAGSKEEVCRKGRWHRRRGRAQGKDGGGVLAAQMQCHSQIGLQRRFTGVAGGQPSIQLGGFREALLLHCLVGLGGNDRRIALREQVGRNGEEQRGPKDRGPRIPWRSKLALRHRDTVRLYDGTLVPTCDPVGGPSSVHPLRRRGTDAPRYVRCKVGDRRERDAPIRHRDRLVAVRLRLTRESG